MNRQLIALSVAGVCVAAGVGGYAAGREEPAATSAGTSVSTVATTPATTPTIPAAATPTTPMAAAPTTVTSRPGAASTQDANGVADGSTGDGRVTSADAEAPAVAKDAAPAPERTKAAAPAAPRTAPTRASSAGSSRETSNDPSGRTTPSPGKTRSSGGGTPTSGADARERWANMSEAERQAMIARYRSMSPAEQKRVRAIACQQYGVC